MKPESPSILTRYAAIALIAAFAPILLASGAVAAGDPAIPSPDVSLLTWTPAQQAWGYRNMEKVYPVKVIARGDEVHPLPVAARPIVGACAMVTPSAMKCVEPMNRARLSWNSAPTRPRSGLNGRARSNQLSQV